MATEEVLCTGEVPDIAAFIKACAFPPEAFVLVERFPQHMVVDRQERQDLLRFARLSEISEIGLYTSGRVFNSDFELRWEREMHRMRVVYVGQARNFPGRELRELYKKQFREWEGRQKSYYLFGERLDKRRLDQMALLEDQEGQGYYAEARIPRLLKYPRQAQRVQLVAREYYEKTTGRVQLFRFLDLEPDGSRAGEAEHESV
ncbi:MAG TPA: CRISPR-associated protein Csx19 [Ktedonobacteraceae bacterium]|nr:CRISPR-associated protein Csx19 [Ktedonobacteraceae bacterium]